MPFELVVAVPPGEPVTVWAVTQIPGSAEPVDASVTVPAMELVPDVRGLRDVGRAARDVVGLDDARVAAATGSIDPDARSTSDAKEIVASRVRTLITNPPVANFAAATDFVVAHIIPAVFLLVVIWTIVVL